MESSNIPVFQAKANTGTVASSAIPAKFIINATVQAVFTDAAAAGTLKLQASNDPVNPVHWSDIVGGSIAVAAGSTSMTPSLPNALSYQWIRAVFVSTGGAGLINGYMNTVGA
jgi:hypothetical protein